MITRSTSLFIFFIIYLLYSFCYSEDVEVFNLIDYGAIGDGNANDTDAFMRAWQATCGSSSNRPTMHVPWGKTFFLHPLSFDGPCNSTRVHVEINGNLVAPVEPSEWICGGELSNGEGCLQWIRFQRVDGLNVGGYGVIDGRGDKWWKLLDGWRTHMFEISHANNVTLGGGLTFKNSPRMQLILSYLNTVNVSNIMINAPEDSPNTDGIHVSGCTNATIDQCLIGTGDDCVSIVNESSFIRISKVICGPGHGISIGSLGKHGANDTIENIHVSDSIFIGTQNGARIKTWQGGKGYARNILFERILSFESRFPIIIDQFYCDHENCVTSESAVQISNVTYRYVLGTSNGEIAVKLDCSETFPCKDIVMEDIDLLRKDQKNASFECNNVKGSSKGTMVPYMSCLQQI